MKKTPVTVVIPAKNESRTIEELIKQCEKYSDKVLVSLSKNSTDSTRKILDELKVEYVIDHGKGKGDGMRCAISKLNSGIVVFIDADGSHNPEDIPSLVKPIHQNESDMVIGSRFLGGSDELGGDFDKFLRMFFTMCIGQMLIWRFKQKILDTQNGFRAISVQKLKQIKIVSKHTEIETELCIKFLKRKFRISEVPAHESSRLHGDSNINIWKDGWAYLGIFLRFIW